MGLDIGDYSEFEVFALICILGWVDLGLDPLYSLLLYITYLGVVYVTHWFHRARDLHVLLLFLALDTHLSIFDDHEGSPVYHYLLFEHVWFIYVSILLVDSIFLTC